MAFADRADFRLLCPYDTGRSTGSVIHEACCSHPVVDGEPSRTYRDAERLLAPFDSPLPPPPATARMLGFELDTLVEVRRLVEHSARRAGLRRTVSRTSCWRSASWPRTASATAAAAGSCASGARTTRWSARSATAAGSPTRWRAASSPDSTQLGGRGLWIANAVCDLVQIRAGRGPRAT